MRKTITKDESGMFNPSKAPAPKLAHLFNDDNIQKFNQCHGANGRFCSGGGGGATGQAGGVQSLEDALAGKPIEPELGPQEVLYPGKEIDSYVNELGVPPVEAEAYTKEIDEIAAQMGTKELHTVRIRELEPNVLAQCEGEWGTENGKTIANIAISVNPNAKSYATARYQEDHMAAVMGNKQPWLASAHADTAEKGYKAVLVHEVGHAALMERTMKQPESEWFSEHNPMYGDKKWMGVINKAHSEGWQGPSLYGKKNPAECFAESLSLLTIKSTTGHRDVDNYILETVGHG